MRDVVNLPQLWVEQWPSSNRVVEKDTKERRGGKKRVNHVRVAYARPVADIWPVVVCAQMAL